MGKLQNKVAIITGGSSGIGRAIANRFAAEGAFVYVVGRREKELAETVAEIGASAAPIRADLARMEDIDAVYARVAADGRTLDIVVANAGRAVGSPRRRSSSFSRRYAPVRRSGDQVIR